jgi:hypothetical protein
MMILSISFAFSPNISLTTLSTDFRWRKPLINFYSSIRLKLGDRVFSKAVIGKEGWVFFADVASIKDYQNSEPLDEMKLDFFQKRLSDLSTSLDEQGITLLIVIPPNKSTIYPQYMPDEIPVLNENSRLDQFIERMNEEKIKVIDLRPVLLSASKNQDVYYKVDTHWNEAGAYYGYYEIINSLTNHDSRLIPHPLSDYEYVYQNDLLNPDLPGVLGIPSIKEERWVFLPKFPVQETKTLRLNLSDGRHVSKMTGQNDQLPSLLIYHDSFYSAHSALSHFMEPHFKEITGVLFNPDKNIWSLDWIQQEEPDIVIIEIVERNLDVALTLLLENIPPSP